MKHGMFIMPFHDPEKPPAQCYDEDLELVVLAEAMGFSEFWIGEHHTHQWENIALPEAFIGKALALTDTIRLGTAPTCLPYHHPAHVATRLAFLDHLSHGRLNLCFGTGSVFPDLELFGIEPAANSAMMEEAAEIILQLWQEDPPYRYDGRFWQIGLEKWVDRDSHLGIIQKPLQRPYPPICAPAMSMNSGTMKSAGRKGWAPISSNLITGNVVADNWKVYEKAALEAGRTPDRNDWRVCRSIFVADDRDEARRRAWSSYLGGFFRFLGGVLDKGNEPGRKKMFKRDPGMADEACDRDYYLDEQIIHGDVDEVVRRLNELRDETGDFGTLILMAFDWNDPEDKAYWLRSTELFVNEVMPAMNR